MLLFQDLKNQMQTPLRNQRGDALLLALVLAFVCMISSMMMMKHTQQVEATTKRPRVKSMMTATEAKVRELLLAPMTYTNCISGTSGRTGRASCNLDTIAVQGLSRNLPDATCPTSAPCGIRVSVLSFNPVVTISPGLTGSRAVVRISYEGTEMSLKEIDVTMDIPADILQNSGIFQCPDTAPKFLGFKPNGQIDCVGITGSAGMGQFVDQIDMTTLTVSAFSLPPTVTCPPTDYVGFVNWGLGGTAFTATCVPRGNPFTTFGFTPGATAADPTYVINTD